MMSLADADTKRASAVLSDEAFPIVDRPHSENSPRLLLPHTVVQTQRLLVRLGRNPITMLHAVILPIFFLITIQIVLGDTIKSITGHSALYGSVPMVTIIATMQGASVGAIGIINERADGLLARLWVVPVHRASGVLSRIIAEAIRVLATTLVLLCVGLLLGLRFERGMLAGLAWVGVPVVFGVAYASLVTTVALYWASTLVVEGLGLLNALGIFFCTGFVPLDQYPQWIQPVVQHQPTSYAVEAMRGLSVGGPVFEPMIGTLLWSAGIAAACAVPMVVGYRRASMRG
jgi:ABC-2 type transport system permease protein